MSVEVSDKIRALISRQPEGHALLREFYKDADVYETEMRAIFGHHWLYGGHVSQFPNIGDYHLVEFDTESIIIVRTGEMDFAGHLNVCRHRGSQICLEPQGSVRSFTCPYHAWAYGLDGQLLAATQMDEGFDKSDYNLHSVHLENLNGFLLISLSKNPPDLTRMRQSLSPKLDLFDTANLKLAQQTSYEIPSNWKLAVENYQECYHCAPAHKEFAQIHAMAKPLNRFQNLKNEYEERHLDKPIMSEVNAYFDLAKPGDEGFQYGRNPLNEGCKSGSKTGQALAPLLGELEAFTGGASELMLGPLMYFLIYDDHIVGYRFLPRDQNNCVCDVYWFVRQDAAPGKDYQLKDLTWLWDVTTQADKRIISDNQNGVNSRFYTPGPLSQMEHFLLSFLRWYLQTIKTASQN